MHAGFVASPRATRACFFRTHSRNMHEDLSDDAEEIRSVFTSAPAHGERDVMLRTTRWLDLGNDDPRVPPAFVIEFSAAAFGLSAFEKYDVLLPPALQRAVPKRQAEFLMGRLAARHAIERLGVEALTPAIGTSREPLWQAGVAGSITHTGDIAAAVAVLSSAVKGIGIDMEKVVDAQAHPALQEFVITPQEQVLLEARRGHLSINTLLTVAFSAKESLFKGLFCSVGRYFDFSAARVSNLNVNTGCLTLTLEEILCPALLKGRSFEVYFKMISADTVATSFVW
jgi:4'-phosphopantetheinyl transferase EntD